jgi:predicted Zn-dependent peptidase
MALADPQIITVNGVAQSMPRTEVGVKTATYTKSDGLFSLLIGHLIGKGKNSSNNRVRTRIAFNQRAIVTNPLDSTNDYDNLIISVLIDRPEYGFTSTQMDQMLAGFKTWLDSTMTAKMYGQES